MGFPVGTKVFKNHKGLATGMVVRVNKVTFTLDSGEIYRNSDRCTYGLGKYQSGSMEAVLWTQEEEDRRIESRAARDAEQRARNLFAVIQKSKTFHEGRVQSEQAIALYSKFLTDLQEIGVIN